ncbi:hypothetical protein EG359_17650 [Chryseobacterium joostei]|uniref:DUF4397 domain-containing protein n=1 Tax=Chryseobacterium joostei TaxID=112234 RepID=A0A1N7K8Y0_9FLAO|nr:MULTISPECIES: hypothetical protein [Chryseobacterium]AZB01324.1 hypothetical protein EG359_17650 [Chryseobacterium joostei]SIS58039.1 hypothetical protein SAMN05421768_11098 [Chryseobacterium joostei]HCM32680.1 hypothetical protein [Chryseobacterium sp.]
MKKILPLILLAGVGFLSYSCDNSSNDPVVVPNPVDHDTFPIMMDAPGSFTAANNYALTADINIETTDVVLVYRRAGNAWQQIPKTVYVDPATSPSPRRFEYNFVFSNKEVQVRIENQNFILSTLNTDQANDFLNNQTFRIVLVPADPQKNKSAKIANVDLSDYNAVVNYYNLDASKIKTISTH